MTLPERYTRIAIWLHWLVAALILTNIVLGLSMDRLADDKIRLAIDTHKSIGITVLGLAMLRLLWRLSHKPPPLPARYPAWELVSANVAHVLLYVLIFAVPLTGWLHDSAWKDAATHPMRWFDLFPWPRIGAIQAIEPQAKEHLHGVLGAVHSWLSYGLLALFFLHLAGALKHQFVDKERELQRMSPF